MSAATTLTSACRLGGLVLSSSVTGGLRAALTVFVVAYPDILPQSGNCWPAVPLTTGDVAYLNKVEQELNAMLATAASENGDTYVDTFTPSIGHDACKSVSVRWIEPVLPESDAFSVHPNEKGMEADASDLEAAMRLQGI